MANLTFADAHNMVTFLSKSNASEVSIKKVNDVVKLQALIDGKRVVVSEYVIRHDLRLDDADGVELPRGRREMNLVVQWHLLSSALQHVENLTFLKTCETLSQKVAHLEQDKIAQALEIIKLKKRVKKLEKQRRSKSLGLKRGRIKAIDADEEITLVDMETQVDLGAEVQGRKDNDNATIKEASAAEPTVFDDEKYVDKQENINRNVVVEQMQEKHLYNIRKYQSLKRKPISVAQAKKNMIVYLKNMAGYKMEHFKGMTYEKDKQPTKKGVAEETLLQESFKKLKVVKVSGSESTQDTPTDDPKEMSEEDVKNMLEIVPVSEFKVEALQVKEDLDALWRMVKEKFSTAVPTVYKWVKLKRLFEPDTEDVLWKLQRYMHYPLTWKLHSNCGVHQRSSDDDLHGGQQTKEQKFGYILQVIKKLELKKLDGLLGINAAGLSLTAAGSRLMLLSKADTAAEETEGITLISVSHIVGLDLSKLAIILNWLKKIHSKGLTSSILRSETRKIFCDISGKFVRIDDEVVQSQRQRDDTDLQDERQDQPNEEKVKPRRSKKARIKKSFGPDFVSLMVENEPTSYR
nr:hypothetical protein [Tanacetum cinerariifolium]